MNRRQLIAAFAALPAIAPWFASAQSSQGIVNPTSLGPSLPPELMARSRNWPVAQGDLSATRSAVDSRISSETVDRLEVQWRVPITASTGYGGMTATPIIIDDLVYLQDMLGNISAIERESGDLSWSYPVDIPCVGPNGVTVAYGRLFAGLGDSSEVISLDAATGQLLWRVRLSNNPGEGIDMAPAVFDSTVYVSTVAGTTTSFNRGGSRGILFALDAATGQTLWQFDTTVGNLWGNSRVNSGGGLWYPPSFDQNAIYFGVANAAPWPGTIDFPNGSSRPGPNDYASSMVCLELETGAVRWHYNAVEHDLLDHDFQNSPILLDLDTGMRTLHLAVGSGKTGTVVAVDRLTGEVQWRTSVGKHTENELELLPDEPVERFPGAWGGVLTPPATDGERIYVPIVNQGTVYSSREVDKLKMFTFTEARGAIVVLDAVSGSIQWETEFDSPVTAGATIVNDLIITGTLKGDLYLLDRSSGAVLRSFSFGSGINAAPAIGGDMMVIPAAATNVYSEMTENEPVGSTQNMAIRLGLFGTA